MTGVDALPPLAHEKNGHRMLDRTGAAETLWRANYPE
jgi:hypothetical protein